MLHFTFCVYSCKKNELMYFKPKSSVTWRAKQVCIFLLNHFFFLLCHSKQVSVSFWKLFQRHLIDNLWKKDFHKGPLATILIKHFWGILCVLPLALGFKWLPSVCKDHEGSYRPESVLSPDRINTVCRLWYCATVFQVISSAEKVGKWYTRYCLIYFITACETITSN